jgi:hypothetical protein
MTATTEHASPPRPQRAATGSTSAEQEPPKLRQAAAEWSRVALLGTGNKEERERERPPGLWQIRTHRDRIRPQRTAQS